MPTLDDIIDGLRDYAGADFAFILTRRGRLVTHHAPENMPEKGRLDLVALAEQVVGSDGVTMRSMPREALVPYGGAAPIDVYVAAREAAVLCAVMATWADSSRVAHAFERGLFQVDELIEAELDKRSQKSELRRRRRALPPSIPPEPEPGAARKAVWGARIPKPTLLGLEDQVAPRGQVAPPTAASESAANFAAIAPDTERRGPPSSVAPNSVGRAFGGLASMGSRKNPPPLPSKVPPAPKSSRPRTQRPPPMRKPTPGRGTIPFMPVAHIPPLPQQVEPEAPDVTVSIANIGHKTMAVIELDALAPDITLGTAVVGRNTLAAIDLASVPSARRGGSMPEIRVGLATMPEINRADLEVPDRATLPFTEAPQDAKRRFDAAGRSGGEGHMVESDPRLSIHDVDFDRASADELRLQEHLRLELERNAREARREVEAETRSRRNSNVEVWREALTELVTDEAKATRRRPRTK